MEKILTANLNPVRQVASLGAFKKQALFVVCVIHFLLSACFSDEERTAILSATLLLMDKRKRYSLLQVYERRRDSNMAYCSVSKAEGTVIWSTAVLLME